MHIGRSLLAVLALLASTTCATRLALADEKPTATPRPKLIVLVYFDQLRGDYLSRWSKLFGKDGFRRLTEDGAWFTECYYPYSNTLTAAGHATVATGSSPETHGIVANEWYSLKEHEGVYCVGSRRYDRVPPLPRADGKRTETASPDLLLAPTIGDALKKATGGKGKIVSLSIKDRSCVLPAGRSKPDAVYWSGGDGRFVTSTYYRDTLHPWVKEFNASKTALRWLDKDWERLRPGVDYAKYAGPDDAPGEGSGSQQGRVFPHPFRKGKGKSLKAYYDAVTSSPMGNELLLEFVGKAVKAEKLGTRDVPDFLNVSFSSNDIVGHAWGPDSQEVLDMTLRADRIVRDLLTLLDTQVGKGKYLLVLTADHGVCPLPEAAKARGKDAGRIPPKPLFRAADAMLDTKFPAAKAPPLIEAALSNMIYLSRESCRARGTQPQDVARALADWLPSQKGFAAAYTRADLEKPKKDDPFALRWKKSYYAPRSGDVMFVLKPYHLLTGSLTGTTHGSPHAYDRHVPLVAFGTGVKPGVRKDLVSPEAASLILAAGLGIAPPAKATAKMPTGLFK